MPWEAFAFWFSAFGFLFVWAIRGDEINRFVLWLLWDFSGLRSIWEKIRPPSEEKIKSVSYNKPPTFLLWVLGIYSALFGIASQRYENSPGSL